MTLTLTGLSHIALAAQGSEAKEGLASLNNQEVLALVGLVVIGIFLILLLFVLYNLYTVYEKLLGNKNGVSPEMENRTFWQKLGSLKPLSMEHEMLMDHKYDDIAELNNPTPPWFMFLFYITIAFGLVYGVIYHGIYDGNIMQEEYTAEMDKANKEHELYMKKFANSVNENNVTLLTDAKSKEAGQKIYTQNCVACHGDQGQGGIGPNFADDFWLHGGSVKEIFHTISEGVPEKGMISWKKSLNPIQMQQLVAYMASFKGTSPANPKAPQGEKIVDSFK
jgi:cytochrome c oxidase cbb3-type subunit III